MKHYVLVFLSSIGLVLCIDHDFKGFDDTILFGIKWPGNPENLHNLVDGEYAAPQKNEILKVTTSSKENYECKIPGLKVEEATNIADYDGPSPINLLNPLFKQKICSYRLETYWSYEVCHGRYIRQYHEEREGKQVNTQEFFLGHWSAEKQAKLEASADAQEPEFTPPTTKVDGGALPYVEMAMDDGTLCDLSGKPRLTRVRYVCYQHGKHEVYSFKETATCEYEVIILSPFLCEHPQFKPKDAGENIIDCIPVGNAPKKPRNLLKQEVDSLRFHHQSIKLSSNDGDANLRFELYQLHNEDDELTDVFTKPAEGGNKYSSTPPVVQPPVTQSSAMGVTDDSPVRAFLNGDNCLNGGTGWWKYEFCYGKHVVQYHIDRDGGKSTLLLGKFDQTTHLNWIKENKGKAPKPVEHRTSVSHFYAGGDVCDKTGKPRQTEVKLKCLENSSSPAQVSLYLLEPRTCHYILGVESPLICDILPLADENGLIKSVSSVLKRQDNVAEPKEEDSDHEPKYILKYGDD